MYIVPVQINTVTKPHENLKTFLAWKKFFLVTSLQPFSMNYKHWLCRCYLVCMYMVCTVMIVNFDSLAGLIPIDLYLGWYCTLSGWTGRYYMCWSQGHNQQQSEMIIVCSHGEFPFLNLTKFHSKHILGCSIHRENHTVMNM